jgi:hypothetical protein
MQGEDHEDSPADVAAQTRDGRSGEAALAAGAVAAQGARPLSGEITQNGLVTRWAPRTGGQAKGGVEHWQLPRVRASQRDVWRDVRRYSVIVHSCGMICSI